MEAYGGLDLLVNNAGGTRDGRIAKLTVDAFDEVVGVHLRGGWLAARAAARAMRQRGGSIVNIVSGTALYGNVGQSNYAAAKGGLLSLTRSLSMELAASNVRVNAVSPIARTSMVEPLLQFAGPDNQEVAEMFGDPADVAAVVAFLASDAAVDVTGQVLGFDGRELTLWSHPTPLQRIRHDGRWSLEQFEAALDGAERATLQPDALGREVQRLLGIK